MSVEGSRICIAIYKSFKDFLRIITLSVVRYNYTLKNIPTWAR